MRPQRAGLEPREPERRTPGQTALSGRLEPAQPEGGLTGNKALGREGVSGSRGPGASPGGCAAPGSRAGGSSSAGAPSPSAARPARPAADSSPRARRPLPPRTEARPPCGGGGQGAPLGQTRSGSASQGGTEVCLREELAAEGSAGQQLRSDSGRGCVLRETVSAR